jgi:multidrug efflux pump subunit AcrA (membrane-fusion protein)
MKNTARHWFNAGVAALLFSSILISSVFAADELYTCGMHPQIIRKALGDCPICGMKLTPVRSNQSGRDEMDTDSQAIHIDTETVQRMNLKTQQIETGPVERALRLLGKVDWNESGYRDITPKYEGWIEKLYVKTTWESVKSGDPLFEIYSPDLYNAELNYLVALRTEGSTGGALTRAAETRLRLFDLSSEFIKTLSEQKEPMHTYTYRSPIDGIVLEKMGIEGQMIQAGMSVFRLANTSSVWVLAQIYENDLPFVQEGQDAIVHLTYGTQTEIPVKITQILPAIEGQTRTATARIVVPNPTGVLRPEMFVEVRLKTRLRKSAVLVPEMAVLRSGERNTVFVARGEGTFEPREVTLGNRSESRDYEVLEGLEYGDEVVTSGQFMLDSESQLREAIQKMLKNESESAEMEMPKPQHAH